MVFWCSSVLLWLPGLGIRCCCSLPQRSNQVCSLHFLREKADMHGGRMLRSDPLIFLQRLSLVLWCEILLDEDVSGSIHRRLLRFPLQDTDRGLLVCEQTWGYGRRLSQFGKGFPEFVVFLQQCQWTSLTLACKTGCAVTSYEGMQSWNSTTTTLIQYFQQV